MDVNGIDTGAELQQEQGVRNAEAFAAEQAIACGRYADENARAYCMAVYIWSRKQDASAPLVPPLPLPTAAPATSPTPIATSLPKK